MNKFFDLDNWREIGATLSRNKTRTFLTGFGIFWGTAMLALLLGGADGLRGIVSQQFAGFATNAVFMWPQQTTISYKGFNKGSEWSMRDRDIAQMRTTVPYIESSSAILNGRSTVEYKNKTKSISWTGVEADYFRIQSVNLLSGRLLNESDDRNDAKVAVIGKDVAAELFGDESPLGKYIKLNGVSFNIVGVASQKSEASIGGRIDEGAIMPFSTMRRAFNIGDRVWFFCFTLEAGHSLKEVKPAIVRALLANHPISPADSDAVGFNDMAENFEMVENVFLAIALLAGFVGAGTLIAGIVGVGNIMWIIVKERTQEIGIRRAIGARPSDIIIQILSEGTVLTAVAGLSGITFAAIILTLADKLTANPMLGPAGFSLPFGRAIAIMVIFLVLGVLAGLIPAVKAMRIKPIEAINDK